MVWYDILWYNRCMYIHTYITPGNHFYFYLFPNGLCIPRFSCCWGSHSTTIASAHFGTSLQTSTSTRTANISSSSSNPTNQAYYLPPPSILLLLLLPLLIRLREVLVELGVVVIVLDMSATSQDFPLLAPLLLLRRLPMRGVIVLRWCGSCL